MYVLRVLALCSGARPLQLSHILGVAVVEVGVGECGQEGDGPAPHHESCRAEGGGGYTVVDADSTAVVGPRMRFGCGRGTGCQQCPRTPVPPTHTCTAHTCLNGGRCYPTEDGVRLGKILSLKLNNKRVFLYFLYTFNVDSCSP